MQHRELGKTGINVSVVAPLCFCGLENIDVSVGVAEVGGIAPSRIGRHPVDDDIPAGQRLCRQQRTDQYHVVEAFHLVHFVSSIIAHDPVILFAFSAESA